MRVEGGALAANPAIVVVAHNRPDSLRRLLGSLERAEYSCRVELVISIDGGGSDEVVKVADEFKWQAGSKDIIRHQKRMGLRSHILACGDLSERYGSVIVLEDDLYVSPVFYHFAHQASEFYSERPEIGGIGLYAYRETRSASMLFEPVADESDVIFLQYACSWGQLWTSTQWKLFRGWYNEHATWDADATFVPAHVCCWPETSWLKYFIKYLVSTNRYFVYPRVSLTTCYQEPGQHYRTTSNRCQVRMQRSCRQFRFKHLAESCAVYDAWQSILPRCINRFAPELAEYDYAVDLYGVKSMKDICLPYMLTCRSSRSPVLEFGVCLRPTEMNVIEGIPGSGIALSATADIDPTAEVGLQLARVYPELGVRSLLRLLGVAVRDRVISRLHMQR